MQQITVKGWRLALVQCLLKNERVEAAAKWTDERIYKFVTERYSDSMANISELSIQRIRLNNGTHNYESMGAATGENRPVTYGYDAAGNRIPGSSGMPGDVATHQVVAPLAAVPVDMDAIREMVRAEVAAAQPTIVHVHIAGREVPNILASNDRHIKFEPVLRKVAAGIPVMLVGPAGSGKTHLCSQVAAALNIPFTFNSLSLGTKESDLFGRTLPSGNDGTWEFQPAPFVETYTNGGLHLFDEIDAADPNLLVSINAAIANGMLSVPASGSTKPFMRHADCYMIAAANTYGNGANRQYVGRNALDAATLNRFTMGTVEIDYDRALETRIAGSVIKEATSAAHLLQWAWSVRDGIGKTGLRRIMSTRNIEDASKLIRGGLTLSDIIETFFLGWTADERSRLAL